MSEGKRSNKGDKSGGRKGRKDKTGSNLGRSIIRQQFPSAISLESGPVLETERGKHKLRSVTQCDDLEELMSNAVLAGTDFTARRGEMLVLGSEARTEAAKSRAPSTQEITVPRRPAWNAQQSAEDLDEQERFAFLEWRRKLAELEEEKSYLLTPFEKNLEVRIPS